MRYYTIVYCYMLISSCYTRAGYNSASSSYILCRPVLSCVGYYGMLIVLCERHGLCPTYPLSPGIGDGEEVTSVRVRRWLV